MVFLYFFALITEEGFLISPCHSLELCIQMGISLLFSFAFCFSRPYESLSPLKPTESQKISVFHTSTSQGGEEDTPQTQIVYKTISVTLHNHRLTQRS